MKWWKAPFFLPSSHSSREIYSHPKLSPPLSPSDHDIGHFFRAWNVLAHNSGNRNDVVIRSMTLPTRWRSIVTYSKREWAKYLPKQWSRFLPLLCVKQGILWVLKEFFRFGFSGIVKTDILTDIQEKKLFGNWYFGRYELRKEKTIGMKSSFSSVLIGNHYENESMPNDIQLESARASHVL